MFVKSQDQKTGDEVIIQGPGVSDLPSSTKSGSHDPGQWYKQFARNMGGMRGELQIKGFVQNFYKTYLENKPYKNLQWPPPPTED